MRIITTALLAASLAAAVLPTAAQAAEQVCLRQNMVNGWKVINDQNLVVYDRVGRGYNVSLEKGCNDLKWPMRLGFSAGTGFGLSCIDRHSFLIVPADAANPRQRCMVSSVTPVTNAPG